MNWSRERWRKLYLRESLQQRLLPVMARGIRDYLIRLAEDDGTLIVDADDPVADLLRALGTHEGELELARQAVELLRRDGFLTGGPRSLIIRNLEAAQEWPRRSEAPEVPAIGAASNEPAASSSAERVRRHRERKREATRAAELASNAAASVSGARVPVTSGVTTGVSVGVTGNVSPVTSGVSPSVTSSRGLRNSNSSESFLDSQRSRKDHHHPSSARASGVTSSVTSSVSRNVSSERFRDREEEDEEEFHRSRESRTGLHPRASASSRGPPMPLSECLLPLLKTAR